MFGAKFTAKVTPQVVEQAAKRRQPQTFKQAAFDIMQDAKTSIEKASKGVAAPPGEPPHTHRGAWLRRSIRYFADAFGAFIGPMHSMVGKAGAIHEHGGTWKGAVYPQRSFMGPALEKNISAFANQWRGTIRK